MLSDEEKEAIEILKLYFGDNPTLNITKYVNIVLNLIKKQSKEIEEYKKQLDLDNECEIALNSKVMDLEKEIEELKDTRSIFNMGRRSYKNEIEGKIKAKIEELNKDFKEYENGQEWEIQDEIRGQIDILQSLLEKE